MRIFYSLLFVIISIGLNARNLVVTLKIEDTQEKYIGLDLSAFYPNGNFICTGLKQQADTTYLFEKIPDEKIMIAFSVEGNMMGEIIETPTDSFVINLPRAYVPKLSKELKEVTVTADNQYITEEKTVFVPSKRVKKSSSNGAELLQRMAIPSVYVSPQDNSISTAGGNAMSVYIDYLPATQNDIANLRTSDVLRVEIYDFPKDPRFGGAQYVVNFIMEKYEYGGYTQLSGKQRVIDNYGKYDVASKFSYKKMTYDLSGGYAYRHSSHNGSNSISKYQFPDQSITRTENTESNMSKIHKSYSVLRAVYQSENVSVSNTLGLNISRKPDYHQLSNTTFEPAVYKSEQALTKNDYSSISPAWNGNYYFKLQDGYSIVFTPSASYAEFSQDYAYTDEDVNVVNNIEENAWNFNVNAILNKQIQKHSLSFSLNGGGQGNNLTYGGTSSAKVNNRYFYGTARLGANLRFGKAWVQGNVDICYNHTSVNDKSKTEIHPKYFIAGGYVFNKKNKLNLSSQMSYWTIPLSQQGDNMQMTNQIDAIQGNPKLEAFRFNSASVSYEWLPLNEFGLSLSGSFQRYTNPVSYSYRPLENSSTYIMVRDFVNSGYLNEINYGGAATLRLFNNSLAIRVGAAGENIRRKGIQCYSGNFINYNAMVYCSLKDFYAQIFYESKMETISALQKSETPDYYTFMVGWGNGIFNIALKSVNLFRSDWVKQRTSLVADNYCKYGTVFDNIYHRSFEMTFSYSFSYGKKVKKTNGPSVGATVDSAILH